MPTQAAYGEAMLANFLASVRADHHNSNNQSSYVFLIACACQQLQFQCEDEYVSSVYGCIINGTFCSDHGTCVATGECQCDNGWEGTFCQSLTSSSDSSLGTHRTRSAHRTHDTCAEV